MNIIIQTTRLLIREFTPQDEAIAMLMDEDDRLTQYVKKRSPKESKQVFKDTLKEYKTSFGLGRWAVFNVADNDFIGVCMLKPNEADANSIELGYRLHFKYWGQGIATELTSALVYYGLVEIGLTEICAVTHPQNIASQKVLAKAGFKPEGYTFWYGEQLPLFKVRKKVGQ
ncbi:MAG: family N-acetyltransferase [Mucilaginibacter sp.]|nr:family N-acetyltransferase [Mucilaginibacter sp.]